MQYEIQEEENGLFPTGLMTGKEEAHYNCKNPAPGPYCSCRNQPVAPGDEEPKEDSSPTCRRTYWPTLW